MVDCKSPKSCTEATAPSSSLVWKNCSTNHLSKLNDKTRICLELKVLPGVVIF